MQRVKYPLTAEAKEWAKKLVKAWDSNRIPQYLVVVEWGAGFHYGGFSGELPDDVEQPPLNILLELSEFNLVSIETETLKSDGIPFLPSAGNIVYSRRWHIVLMQELRNAVKKRFAVSDYFLTFNAVGTIIQGDATISAPFQSVGLSHGNVSQQITSSELADKLLAMIASDILQSNPDLTAAIQELRTSLESERESKIGKVISELGRILQHGANTLMVVQVIGFLNQVLS